MSEVPEHEHIMVDEETYWGLMYLHAEVQSMIRQGEHVPGSLAYLSNDAEGRLVRSRKWNEIDPDHHSRVAQ